MILKLRELCELYKGRNIDKSKLTGSGTPYIIGASNIRNGVISTDVYVNEATVRNPGIALKGDIVVSTVGTIGKIGILQLDRAVLSGHVCSFRPKMGIDQLYLVAMLTGALCQELETDGDDRHGFSNKIDPAALLDLRLCIASEEEQRYLVLALVRFAVTQVASHMEHITATDIQATVDKLNELTARTRKALRDQSTHIDKLFAMLSETCVDPNADDPENPFNLLLHEQHRIQNLLKII